MFRLSALFGKLVILLLRVTGRGGSALPGLIVERMKPDFMSSFAERLPNKSILVTGTNGKTTTTKIVSAIYSEAGYRVLTNKTGSNFNRGIVSAIVDHMTWFGSIPYDIAILEVDEAYSPTIAEAVKPQLLCALNVFRDQLDRFGELDSTVARISKAAHHADAVVVNGDDPNLSEVAGEARKIVYFGADSQLADRLPSDPHMDKKASAVTPDYLLANAEQAKDEQRVLVKSPQGEYKFKSLLLGLHNAINLTAAIAISEAGGIKNENILDTVSRVKPAFGRGESIVLGNSVINLLLVKNPAGFNQVIRSLEEDSTDCLALVINDQIADGRDVSWLWDAHIELLSELNPSTVVASGSRASDMAVRLKYENIKSEILPSIRGLITDIKKSKKKNVVIIATYTAMLEIREELKGHTEMEDFWK